MMEFSQSDGPVAPGRRPRWWWVLTSVPIVLLAACWWLTEPLGSSATATRSLAPRLPALVRPPAPAPALNWPEEGTLQGDPAKRLLLDRLLAARSRLDRVEGYTATFHKQERIGGTLGPEQTLRLKSRPRPFAIYLKFLAPKPGKEVVFACGQHDDKLIVHSGDWKDRLIPRLKVDPTARLALVDCRHPITDAGLLALTDKLIRFRRMDLVDAEAVTILDRVTDPQGRRRLRSVHSHPHRKPDRPFAHVEVLYDPETSLPLRISSYDWPEPDQPPGKLRLAERYSYDDLDLHAPLTDLDFDPANPSYAFSRF